MAAGRSDRQLPPDDHPNQATALTTMSPMLTATPPLLRPRREADTPRPVPGATHRVLLVEDNPVDAMRIRQLLARSSAARFDVESVATLAEAQHRAATGEPDVILLDLDLPDSLGLASFTALSTSNPEIPIVVLCRGADEALGFEAVRQGAQDLALKAASSADGLARTIRCALERHRLLASLRGMSLTDDLTGLLNRRGFTTITQGHLRLASRTGQRFLLFYADLDGLKAINDGHGHQEGDRVLVRAADVLRRTFRQSDVLARLGGDEFVGLALDSSGDQGATILRRLATNIGADNAASLTPYQLSLSVGVLAFDGRCEEPLGALLARADRQLYQQKRTRESGLARTA